MLWNVESDTFGFTIAIKDKPVTRRGILSVVSSIYDPLGFAAPFILIAKEILQDLCRMNLGWDDQIPEDHLKRETWLRGLHKLETLKINRCFRPSGLSDVVTTELHHFSDASQQGYGAVSYLRTTDLKGDNHGKGKIGAPEISHDTTIGVEGSRSRNKA